MIYILLLTYKISLELLNTINVLKMQAIPFKFELYVKE